MGEASGLPSPSPSTYTAGSPFPPIADYGFLSDSEVNALVSSSGSIEWMCLPRPDSPSVFAALLDRGAGAFRLGPGGITAPVARQYLPGTLVLETTWQAPSGWLVLLDVLLIGPWYHRGDRPTVQRRSPTDYEAEHTLLRIVQCTNGRMGVALDCEPSFDYGRRTAQWSYGGPGYDEALATCDGDDLTLRLTTDLRLGLQGNRAQARAVLDEGERAFVALSWGDGPGVRSCDEAFERLERTAEYWRRWLSHGQFPDHPWRAHLQRSALTLKGLTYSPTGAMLAAATTSLPETPLGIRNWDYRFSWVRDATFALQALYALGYDWEANDFFLFVADVCADADLQVAYGIDGERTIEESTLDHLYGYEGARPVRVGNAAYSQVQHDIWGAVLDCVYVHTRSRDHLPERAWPILRRHVEAVVSHWREPDNGLWEVRGQRQHFTFSKMMCWVACDRGARLAQMRDEAGLVKRWRETADEIHADVCANGVDDQGVFTQFYGTTALDASLLLMPLLGFLPGDDDRVRATVTAIGEKLTEEGLVLRYRVEETDDGLVGREGAFTTCSFWLVSAFVEIGELENARRLAERLLGYATPLGLYAEEFDPRWGRHLGNIPQALTHLALINALLHVIRAESSAPPRAEIWRACP